MPVDQTFDLRYQPRTENTGEGEREIQEDDLTTAFYENAEIDLGQLMRRAVLPVAADETAVPRRLQGCARPAAPTGTQTLADCKHEWDDPRLDALGA